MSRATDGDVTIVAVATPEGHGGIGIVRISGPKAISIGRQLFRCRPALGDRPRQVQYGRVFNANGTVLDTGLAWVLKAPKSYTGEDTVEISSHGSRFVLQSIVEAAVEKGAANAQPGEFTRRAFLNGRIDLLQAEAVLDLIQAGSEHSLQTSYGQASGRLSLLVQDLKKHVVGALSLIEVGLDFVEEEEGSYNKELVERELTAATDLSTKLVESFNGSRQRNKGYLVALIGLPNVGKSTLLNALLNEERAIVSDIPGTTRDLVEGSVVWGKDLLKLVDSAGFRVEGGVVEQEGVRRARGVAKEADIILVVTDTSTPWHQRDADLLKIPSRGTKILVANKCDLLNRQHIPLTIAKSHPPYDVSAAQSTGLRELQEGIKKALPRPQTVDGVGLTRQRHVGLVQGVLASCNRAIQLLEKEGLPECAGAELHVALKDTGELLGEDVGEDVLDRIFSEFCIGK